MIKPGASQADIAFVESHRADLPVLELMMVQRRRYQHGEMLANTIGYVGEVSAQQLEESDGHYRPGDIVGKAGLERQYNDQLEGTDGMRRVIVNSVGKAMRTLDDVEAIPGKPIQLTIDYDLQAIAEADMADKSGARRRARWAHRRSPGYGQPPHLRSQRFRRSHSGLRMGQAQYRSCRLLCSIAPFRPSLLPARCSKL